MTPLPRLKRERVAAGLSQRDLAERAGVTQTTIVKAEQGTIVRPSTVRKLARALGVQPRDLIDGATLD